MPRLTPDSEIKSSEVLLRNFTHFIQRNVKKMALLVFIERVRKAH